MPASGSWVKTHAPCLLDPEKWGTSPKFWSFFAAKVAVISSSSGTTTGAVGLWMLTVNPAVIAVSTRTVMPASDATDWPGCSAVGVKSAINGSDSGGAAGFSTPAISYTITPSLGMPVWLYRLPPSY